jgi:hypothetical protein
VFFLFTGITFFCDKKYLSVRYWLLQKISDRTILGSFVDHAIGLIRESENKKEQNKGITLGMVEPYIKKSVGKYCQENNVKADDNQIQWVANVLLKHVNNEISQSQKEKAAQTKIKKMLASESEDNPS